MPNTLLFFIVLFLIGFLANSPALFGASMGLLAFSGLYELVIRTLKRLLSEKQSLEDSSPIAYLRQTLLNPIAFTLYGGGFILLAFNTSVSQGAIALFIGFSCLIIAGIWRFIETSSSKPSQHRRRRKSRRGSRRSSSASVSAGGYDHSGSNSGSGDCGGGWSWGGGDGGGYSGGDCGGYSGGDSGGGDCGF